MKWRAVNAGYVVGALLVAPWLISAREKVAKTGINEKDFSLNAVSITEKFLLRHRIGLDNNPCCKLVVGYQQTGKDEYIVNVKKVINKNEETQEKETVSSVGTSYARHYETKEQVEEEIMRVVEGTLLEMRIQREGSTPPEMDEEEVDEKSSSLQISQKGKKNAAKVLKGLDKYILDVMKRQGFLSIVLPPREGNDLSFRRFVAPMFEHITNMCKNFSKKAFALGFRNWGFDNVRLRPNKKSLIESGKLTADKFWYPLVLNYAGVGKYIKTEGFELVIKQIVRLAYAMEEKQSIQNQYRDKGYFNNLFVKQPKLAVTSLWHQIRWDPTTVVDRTKAFIATFSRTWIGKWWPRNEGEEKNRLWVADSLLTGNQMKEYLELDFRVFESILSKRNQCPVSSSPTSSPQSSSSISPSQSKDEPEKKLNDKEIKSPKSFNLWDHIVNFATGKTSYNKVNPLSVQEQDKKKTN